jgi:hypothetical protein
MAATKLRLYGDAARLLADSRFTLITDDVETRYHLDDAYPEATEFVLRQAPWRFALKTVSPSIGGTLIPGFTRTFSRPADWLRTHAIFTVGGSDGREHPIDLREHGTSLSLNDTGTIYWRYISSAFTDPEQVSHPWPESFAQAVAAYLAFLIAERVTGEPNAAGRMSQLFSQYLERARELDAEPEDRWLPYQRNGEMERGALDLLRHAFWRFAMRTLSISVQAGTPSPELLFSFEKPDDWLRTHKLFIVSTDERDLPFHIQEHGNQWSTDRTSFRARYISTQGSRSVSWDEPFRTAMLAYLEAGRPQMPAEGDNKEGVPGWYQAVLLAKSLLADPDDFWLPFQLSGDFLSGNREVLSDGAWRFAALTVPLTVAATPPSGYNTGFEKPADFLSTLALYQVGNDPVRNRAPVDVREEAGNFYVNAASTEPVMLRYTSSISGMNPENWPDSFVDALRAWLLWRTAVPGEAKAHALTIYRAARDAALAMHGEPLDAWLPYQQSGVFARVSREMHERAFWRFAMRLGVAHVEGDADVVTDVAGYTRSVEVPSEWTRTRALYTLTDSGERRPIDILEQGGKWYVSHLPFYADFMSDTLGMDARLWPAAYMQAVYAGCVLATAPAETMEAAVTAAAITLNGALQGYADPPDPWLEHQLSGAFRRHVPAVMARGNWWWALAERQYSSLVDQLPSDPAYGYPYRYPLPDDWFKSHALFIPWDGQECPINIRETSADWSTDAETFVARYVSTEALNTALWPQNVDDAVLAFLQLQSSRPEERQLKHGEFDLLFGEALRLWSRPDDDWLRFQLDGSYRTTVQRELEGGRWRFALRVATLTETSDPLPAELSTGVSEYSFAYRHIWPSDLIRTVRVYYEHGAAPYVRRSDIPFADIGGAYHADITPVTVRYVSRLGLDSTKWTAHFRDAVLARLQYEEVRNNPAMAHLAAAKLAMYKDASSEAEQLDDARDRVVRRGSRFVAARGGRSWSTEYSDYVPTAISGPPVIDP